MANVFAAAKITIADRRRGLLLAYKGYLYSRNRTRETRMYWRCIENGCGVFVHTNVFEVSLNAENFRILREPEGHSHRPCDSSITRREMVRNMLDIVQGDPCAPVRSSYDNVTTNPAFEHADAVPSFHSLQDRLRRRRQECFPPIPRELDDVDIVGEWALTWNDRRHLSAVDNGWGLALFLTDRNARTLFRCDSIFIDGTFRTAPHPYKQLVTISGFYRENVIPLCFCLLAGKTVGLYRQLLQRVRDRLRTLHLRHWNPQNVLCDFEMALIVAVETELPGSRVRGCYFHFTQSLWRKVASLGLVGEYRRDSRRGRRFKKIIQKFMAIGFIPPLVICRVFQDYVASRTVANAVRRQPRLQDFINYLYATYIGPNAMFRPPMWSVHGRSMSLRTNNCVESYHSRWNKIVSVRHPSLWKFIMRLKDEERRVAHSVRQTRAGLQLSERRRKWRKLEERLDRLKRQYTEGTVTLSQYWDAVRFAAALP